ncbi:hypothetical protein ACFLSQ_05180 [Bacteroidota bacterium]
MFIRILAVAISFLISISQIFAQDVEEIIKKSLDSRGNLKVFTEAKSMIITGDILQMGMNIPFKYYMKDKKKYRFENEMMGQKSIQAYDGDTLWMSAQGKIQLVPEQYFEQVLKGIKQTEGLIKGPLVNYKEKDNEVEFSGNVNEDGRDSYTLKYIDNENDIEGYLYVDKNTNELFKLWQSVETPQGEETEVEVKFSDYKDVNEFKVPHKINIQQGEQGTIAYSIDKIVIGVQIDDSLFVKPAK